MLLLFYFLFRVVIELSVPASNMFNQSARWQETNTTFVRVLIKWLNRKKHDELIKVHFGHVYPFYPMSYSSMIFPSVNSDSALLIWVLVVSHVSVWNFMQVRLDYIDRSTSATVVKRNCIQSVTYFAVSM